MRNTIHLKPVGNEYGLETQFSHSDIYELSYVAGLRVTVITSPRGSLQTLWLEYYFSHPTAFRYLDEGDMLRWQDNDELKSGHHLYEVTSGGWLSEDTFEEAMTGKSTVQCAPREWLIDTAEGYVGVVASEPPLIRELLCR